MGRSTMGRAQAGTGKAHAGVRTGRRERITRLLSKIEDRLEKDNVKATLADFIRLTQLERELEDEERPKEIVVKWVEPTEPQDTAK
jgi:hypothetical protein